MKTSILGMGLAGTLLLTGCFTSNDSSGAQGVIPESDKLFYSIPSSVANENPSESLLVVEPELSAKLAESTDQEEGIIFAAYQPIPKYIYFAEQAKNTVKEFVKELRTHDIPEEFDEVKDGLHIISRSVDTTILGADQKFFTIQVKDENENPILAMNYWKNARDQYRGNFYFTDRDPSSGNLGAAIHVHFNGHNESLFGKRMLVTFYRPEELLENANDPSIIRVWSRKKGNRVFVTGGSYHPTFEDEFWEKGPKVYAFRTVANTEKDRAVLRVAFADANEDLSSIFKDYSIDEVIVDRFVNNYQKEIDSNDTLALSVAWSLENEKDLKEMYTQIALETFVAPTLDVSNISTEQFIKYINFNKEFFSSEAKRTGDKGFFELIALIEMEQPIYIVRGGIIVGGKQHQVENEFGVEAVELESVEMIDSDLSELGAFDPELQVEPEILDE